MTGEEGVRTYIYSAHPCEYKALPHSPHRDHPLNGQRERGRERERERGREREREREKEGGRGRERKRERGRKGGRERVRFMERLRDISKRNSEILSVL
jgi:hypothetical protein